MVKEILMGGDEQRSRFSKHRQARELSLAFASPRARKKCAG